LGIALLGLLIPCCPRPSADSAEKESDRNRPKKLMPDQSGRPARLTKLEVLAAWVCLAVIALTLYSGFVVPYFLLPGRDEAFLARYPSREEVLRHFGSPSETLGPGEQFRMTGWHPLPQRTVSGSAFCFVRSYGSKLHVFFAPGGEMEQYVISHS
jgi:hypothetical protein